MSNEQEKSTERRQQERRVQPESLESMLEQYREGERGMPTYAELRALVCEPVASPAAPTVPTGPRWDRVRAAALKEAVAICDRKFNERSASGHPREASAARACREEILALMAGAAPQPLAASAVPAVTQEMIDAAEAVEDLYRLGRPELWGKVFRAMLTASPTPAATMPDGQAETRRIIELVREIDWSAAWHNNAALQQLEHAIKRCAAPAQQPASSEARDET